MPHEERRKHWFGKSLLIGALVALLLPIVYFLSAGPVFAYCYYRGVDRLGICRYYCPVAHVASPALAHYLNFCGVPDIPAFFLLNGGRHECACGYSVWRSKQNRALQQNRDDVLGNR